MDNPTKPEVILTLLRNIARALKPQGRVGVIDFTAGDGGPGPSSAERISPDRVIATAARGRAAAPARELVPPYQFMLVFGRDPNTRDSP